MRIDLLRLTTAVCFSNNLNDHTHFLQTRRHKSLPASDQQWHFLEKSRLSSLSTFGRCTAMLDSKSGTTSGGNDALASSKNPTTENKCVPCSSLDTSSLLTLEQINASLIQKSMPLWKVQEIPATNAADNTSSSTAVLCLSRKYTAKNFQVALDSINAMGVIAEREGHHPDFHLTSYRDVEVVIFTHKVQGVTENDLQLAKMFDDEVNIVYSPKWLKENPEAK